jgi:hypothetical protein
MHCRLNKNLNADKTDETFRLVGNCADLSFLIYFNQRS